MAGSLDFGHGRAIMSLQGLISSLHIYMPCPLTGRGLFCLLAWEPCEEHDEPFRGTFGQGCPRSTAQ